MVSRAEPGYRRQSRRGFAAVMCLSVTMVSMAGAGCGAKFPLVPVSGTVRMDGEPLAGAFVVFSPVEPAAGSARIATGVTDARGQFSLRTNYEPRWTGNGAVPGAHRVTLAKTVAAADLPPAVYAKRLAEHRKQMRAVGIRPSSPADDVDQFGVELVPTKYLSTTTTPLSVEVRPNATNDFAFELD